MYPLYITTKRYYPKIDKFTICHNHNMTSNCQLSPNTIDKHKQYINFSFCFNYHPLSINSCYTTDTCWIFITREMYTKINHFSLFFGHFFFYWTQLILSYWYLLYNIYMKIDIFSIQTIVIISKKSRYIYKKIIIQDRLCMYNYTLG